ncbi:MAG: VOC family protein [Candidatus Cloacimonetes bacterium]|nr:VOC family protein [Candidatus Cloacimonadota bacterium]
MIGYTTIGTNDLDRAVKFYDELFTHFNATKPIQMDRFIAWSLGDGGGLFGIIKPFNEEEATPGNGNMVALRAKSQADVDALYKKALELGGTDEGAPGMRNDVAYFSYFRDLDGNKICFCHFDM